MKALRLVLDLAGTFVFALRGAITAVRHRLDLYGILVLSLAAATFGGIARDLVIGAVPPAALSDWRYISVSCLAGAAVFFFSSTARRPRASGLTLCSVGLALFSVAGTLKAPPFGSSPLSA